MVSEKETASIRGFVCGQLSDKPDLSTLTLGVLKKRYLARVGQTSLSPEARNYMKQVVQEELMKMQDSDDSGGELETKKPQNKRKRGNDEVISEGEDEDESRAKKSRRQSVASSESEVEEGCKTGSAESEGEDQMKSGSEGSEEEVQAVTKSEQQTNGSSKQKLNSEDSTDEEMNESRKKGNESDSSDSPKEMVKKKGNATKSGAARSGSASPAKKTPQSDEEDESDADSKSEKSDKKSDESSDDNEKEEKAPVEKKDNNSDSDSSSLPSLEDHKDSAAEDKQVPKKKKTVKKEQEESARGKKDDNKAVVRLKRYISLCGVKRNYKKLLDGCRSIRSMVAVLKKELEDLGVEGQPSIKKCKKVKMMREEAQELAELNASNIISTQSRSKRRGASTREQQHDPPSSAYQRTLNSDSDSDRENNPHSGRRRATDWANLQGIISDDADSD